MSRMNEIDETSQGEYIVIKMHQWGADESLSAALENCDLYEARRLDHFQDVDSQITLGQVYRDWLEWGKENWESYDGDNERVVIYYLSPLHWKGWAISSIDGSLTAFPRDPDQDDDLSRALLNQYRMDAIFNNGVLIPTDGEKPLW